MSDVPELHIVTGKGGVGKTTVAAAIAIALAESGARVLVVETETRSGLARALGLDALTYDERNITGDWRGSLRAQSIEPSPALIDYVARFYRVPGARTVLQRSGASTFVTAIAPGLSDVLITGKIAEAARRPADGGDWSANRIPRSGYVFDAVVVDAPPTGRVEKFLDVTSAVTDVAPIGRIREHATRIRDVIHSERSRVHIVTTPEELPIQEAVDAAAGLRRHGLQLGTVIVNRSPQELPLTLTVSDIEAVLRDYMPAVTSRALAVSLRARADNCEQAVMRAKRLTATLTDIDVPQIQLPELVTTAVSELGLRLARVLPINAVRVPQ